VQCLVSPAWWQPSPRLNQSRRHDHHTATRERGAYARGHARLGLWSKQGQITERGHSQRARRTGGGERGEVVVRPWLLLFAFPETQRSQENPVPVPNPRQLGMWGGLGLTDRLKSLTTTQTTYSWLPSRSVEYHDCTTHTGLNGWVLDLLKLGKRKPPGLPPKPEKAQHPLASARARRCSRVISSPLFDHKAQARAWPEFDCAYAGPAFRRVGLLIRVSDRSGRPAPMAARGEQGRLRKVDRFPWLLAEVK
jgi:hypothetical protein